MRSHLGMTVIVFFMVLAVVLLVLYLSSDLIVDYVREAVDGG